MNFRHDINGLRAFAVIAVVLFHFDANWLPGGFAGVDVFFVISGYLMTAIIFKGVEQNNFSLTKFYLARAKRIVPALTVLSTTLLVFGWFYLYNVEYAELSKHAFNSLLFWSNHTYWLEAGYFDAGSHEKWLLHTWSLSAEWQFYIIYPIVVALLAKIIPLRWLKILLCIAATASFGLCIVASIYWPDAAYFLLPTRAWQMLLGGLAFLYPIAYFKNKKSLEGIGFLLIIISYIFIDKYQMWPGYLALLPVLGAFLIIQAHNNESIMTNNVFCQKIGLWSYSIYLWHWPVVVYIQNFIDNITLTTQLLGITISVILGFISFHSIEKSTKRFLLFSLYFATLLSAYYLYKYNGVEHPSRSLSQSPVNEFINKHKDYYDKINDEYSFNCKVSSFKAKTGKYDTPEKCYDITQKGGVFLWGDSHVGALAPGIRIMMPDTHIAQITSSGCPSSFTIKQGNISKLRIACDKANELALSVIKKTIPETVIIANKDKHEILDWHNTVSILKDIGVKNIVVISPVPQWYPSLPIVYAKQDVNSDYLISNKLDKNIIKTNKAMLSLTAEIDGLVYIDVLNQVCDLSQTPTKCKVIYNDELIAWDYGHLTRSGSIHVAKNYILPILNQL